MKPTPPLSLITILALGAAYSTQAQDKLLPPTYLIGKEYVLESKQDIEVDMGALGAAIGQPGLAGKTTTQILMEVTTRCKMHSEPGQRSVTTKVSRMKMDVNAMGMQMKYDSAEAGSGETMLGQQLKGMSGTTITMILGEDDSVISVEGLDNLPGAGGAGIDVEQLKQMANPANQLGIPAGGVAVGAAWENGTEFSLGGQVGTVKSDLNLKYDRDEEVDGASTAVVACEGAMNMAIEAKAQGGGAGPGLKMKVEDGVMKGEMRIDKKLRFLRDAAIDMELTSKMGNPANPDQQLGIPMKIKQTMTLKSVTDF